MLIHKGIEAMGASPLVSIQINVLQKSITSIQYFRGGGVQAFFLAIGKFYKAEIFVERIKFQEMREAITHNRS